MTAGMYTYFRLQLKRVIKLLPALLAAGLATCVCVGALAAVFLQDGVLSENRKKYRIGVVGELEESYLGLQFFNLIRTMDDSRFTVELLSMSEEEAASALRRGELSAYARIPEGLVESLDSGANDVFITYVAGEGQKGIGGILMQEMVEVVSVLVTRSQSAVYGMQELLYAHGRGELWAWATEELCLRLVDAALSRTDFCEVEVSGIGNGLSLEGYYFCSILIFVLLLSGICNSALFLRRSEALPGLLAARGTGAGRQVAGEYSAYLILPAACMAVLYPAIAYLTEKEWLVIPEWRHMGAEPLAGFLAGLLPVAAMAAALQFLLYEAVTGIVSGVLLQFVCAVGLAYVSGYFYPAGFFPESVQQIGKLLPTGVALRYADGLLTGEAPRREGAGILLYTALFLGLSVLLRRYRTEKR